MKQFKYRCPSGGHIYHVVVEGKYSALCGYSPSSPRAWRMRQRARWALVWTDTKNLPPNRCEKCLKEMRKTTEGWQQVT